MTQKVALITGSARRIGHAIAKYLHNHGFQVIIHYRHSATLAATLANTLNHQRPSSACILQADFHKDDYQACIKQAVDCYGQLDLLVNNASGFFTTTIGQTTVKQWDDLMACNSKAPFFLTQAAAPHLAKTQGSVVNISDIHGQRPVRNYAVYCSSKAALDMQTKALAKELGPNVRVNGVAPGAIAWPEGDNTLDEAQKQAIIDCNALKRAGSPHDIAQAVYYLSQARYVTGHILAVDGGRSLRS